MGARRKKDRAVGKSSKTDQGEGSDHKVVLDHLVLAVVLLWSRQNLSESISCWSTCFCDGTAKLKL